MSAIPAHCPYCGAIFASIIPSIAGGRVIGLSGNKETCRNCGRWANVADGVFEVNEGVINLVSGPNVSRELVKRFSIILADAANKRVSIDEFKHLAKEIDPSIGKAAEKIAARPGLFYTISVILLIVLSRCNFEINIEMDVNQLFDQAVQTLNDRLTGDTSESPQTVIDEAIADI